MTQPLRVSKQTALGRVVWFRCQCDYELSGVPARRNPGASSGWAGTVRMFVPAKMRSPVSMKAVLAGTVDVSR